MVHAPSIPALAFETHNTCAARRPVLIPDICLFLSAPFLMYLYWYWLTLDGADMNNNIRLLLQHSLWMLVIKRSNEHAFNASNGCNANDALEQSVTQFQSHTQRHNHNWQCPVHICIVLQKIPTMLHDVQLTHCNRAKCQKDCSDYLFLCPCPSFGKDIAKPPKLHNVAPCYTMSTSTQCSRRQCQSLLSAWLPVPLPDAPFL